MSHLESLIAEYYGFSDYLVKRNVKVGRLPHGGWEMELDIVAYHPHKKHLIHVEPSLDAYPWERREERFAKKFKAGKKYILKEVFTWLGSKKEIEQVAVLPSHPKGRNKIAGGHILSVDEQLAIIRQCVEEQGLARKKAIPEQYPLLRTLQLSHCGYTRALPSSKPDKTK